MTELQSILSARHQDPFSYLGMHETEDGVVLRVFRPESADVDVVDVSRPGRVLAVPMIHSDGFFELTLPGEKPFPYLLRWKDYEDGVVETEDPYAFGLCLGDQDMHYFREGTHYELHKQLGAQLKVHDGVAGTQFAVWAPNAQRVSVVGDFNRWDGRTNPLRKRIEGGLWELFLPRIGEGVHYKFEVLGHDNQLVLKSDPFAFFSQNGLQTASIVHDLHRYQWNDAAWMQKRAKADPYRSPMSIYEVHAGSWKRVPEEGNRSLTYREMADQLVDYVVALGFTHIEFLPLAEHPFDGSWGYQVCGFFAPTSRFGAPDDFRYLVDKCHQRGLGVILDWVPGHFPKDQHGLARFDGTNLYEHADPRKGEHRDWGTLIFNYGRNEVANFLMSNALFWLEEYHIDGLRVDAVASMLYLDYSREAGDWIPNQFGGRENLEAIQFLRRFNEVVYERHPGVYTIAEESTSWPGVSRPTSGGGLGFGFKWNMGWMNDTLRYFQRDPIHRVHHHNEATFSLIYAYHENFILVLSHDEVVHGKGSLLDKMPGDLWQKFANLRLLYGWMWMHPGKKLLFMGGEFGQWLEWSHQRSLDWHLCFHENHRGLSRLIHDLNLLYLNHPALFATDHEGSGYRWLEANAAADSYFAFQRTAPDGKSLYVVVNATPVPREGLRIGVEHGGDYREVLNSDSAYYGGSNLGNQGRVISSPTPWQGLGHSITVTLPPLAVVVLEREY